MNRTKCALVATAVSPLLVLCACGSLNRDTTGNPPGAASPTVLGTATTQPSSGGSHSMSMDEDHSHTPIPANTDPVSAAEIHKRSRLAVFSTHGQLPDGSGVWGSAFIHDLGAGLAITNAHVVDGMQGLEAVFFDGTEQPLDVVGSDPCTDLAVVHVSGDLPEGSVRLPLGDSDTLAPGDDVTAVGYRVNPQSGSTRSVPTNGIVQDLNVSATVDPSLPELTGAIQHGATLQPASSGGPLLDNKGNVVGVNAMAGPADPRGQYYAIPINTAHPETDQLMTGRDVNNLGWTLTPRVAERAPAEVEETLRRAGYDGGMFVESTEPGSPVDGHVLVGDLVSKLGNTPVNSQQDVCDVLGSSSSGRVMTADGIHVFSKPTYQAFHVQWRMP
jgi:serine protease Do